MLSCKETSLLVSRSLDERLAWRERWAVGLHLLMCRACARCKSQLKFLQHAARQIIERGGSMGETARLSPDARARIERVLVQSYSNQ